MNKKRYLGFALGEHGDLVIQTVAAKQFKRFNPDAHLTLAIGGKFHRIAPLFKNHKYFDDYIIFEGYDDFPTLNDRKIIENGGLTRVFNPMPKHSRFDWYNYFHYTQEYTFIQGLGVPDDLQCELTRPTVERDTKLVTIAAFPSMGKQPDKTLSKDKWQDLVSRLNSLGYKCVQLGGVYDIPIDGCIRPDLSFEQAAHLLASSKVISTDTSWAWIASAYQQPCVYLFGKNYPDLLYPANLFPLNPNGIYNYWPSLKDASVDDIIKSFLML